MKSPFSSALWIGASAPCEAPVITRTFSVAAIPETAVLRITALGFFEATINGKAVTPYHFLPVLSDFEKRDTAGFAYPIYDTFTHRVYYYDFDVTDLLTIGENVLDIHLGNGWYRQKERLGEGNMCFGETLKVIFRLDWDEQTLLSDENALWRDSDIRYSNIYIGEVQDKTFSSAPPAPVCAYSAPNTQLTPAIGTPDKFIRTITPVLLDTVDGKRIYDAGENISGVVRVHTSGQRGEQIVLRFSEEIHTDHTLNVESTGGLQICATGKQQTMTDTFICDGTPTVFAPKFSWHAFRYFEVDGPVDSLEVAVIHSDCPVTSRFNSSSEGLNFLYDAFIRTQLSNMHSSLPSDCPHRERLGYTGDGQLCAAVTMMTLDCREFYRKWIQDILDCQDTIGGHVQHTAPFMGGGGGPGGWGNAIVVVPYAYYKQYGEIDMLEKCFEPMCRWLDYLTAHLTDNLLTREEPKGWCLGDWCTLHPISIPEPFVNTCLFIKALRTVADIARILGKKDAVSRFTGLDARLCAAIQAQYLDADGHYCQDADGADIFALDIGLLDENSAARIAEKYRQQGFLETGIFGTPLLFEALFVHGYADVALSLLDSEQCGSFLYMKRHGATTLWEYWYGRASHSHPMFGASAKFLFTDILGITQVGDGGGYQTVCIRPQIPQGLAFADGAITTPQGEIAVAYKQQDGFVAFDVTVPKGISASFCFKGKDIPLTPQSTLFKNEQFSLHVSG